MIKLAILLFVSSIPAMAATPDSWTPKAEFSLEGGTLNETMIFVSGWAYAMTEVGRASASSGKAGPICLPAGGHVESRVLFAILNKRFKGTTITSEQASEALWAGAVVHYRCGKRL